MREHGKPDLFIVVICNPELSEILEARGGLKPDIFAHVFHLKLDVSWSHASGQAIQRKCRCIWFHRIAPVIIEGGTADTIKPFYYMVQVW